VIRTDGTREETDAQVERIWRKVLTPPVTPRLP
jgi:hypothetical protein